MPDTVVGTTLPREILDDHEGRLALEGAGVVFDEAVPSDATEIRVTLPEGWEKRPPHRHGWPDEFILTDSNGRTRAEMRHRGPFDVRISRFTLGLRYTPVPDEPGNRYSVRSVVMEEDAEIYVSTKEHPYTAESIGYVAGFAFPGHTIGPIEASIESVLHAESEAWLDEHRPNWRDPVRCWDD